MRKLCGLGRPLRRFVLYLALTLFSTVAVGHATTRYAISLANPEQHLVEVQIFLPQGAAERELQLPVWNALYQIRDFSQYVNWVRARDAAGRAISVRELDKSRWQISAAEHGAVVDYQIYVDSAGPFGAQLNAHHAFFNLGQIIMYPVDARNAPITVRFSGAPPEWKIATSLASSSEGEFSADNYDHLVDSPVEIGTFKESDFDEGGAHYRVVVDAEPSDYDMEKIEGMLRQIVAAATVWMDDRPYATYLFLFHFPRGPAGGGMEHSYSTAIDVSAEWLTGNLEVLASVTAHEFFHLWNVKRIRPQTLEPVDYTKENYTRALWFSEGCTSTAADFIELRGGLLDEKQFEKQLAAGIAELEHRPAHLTQSAEESSLDAWLEGDPYYRRSERSISYYNKGELLGIMLDLAVREASHGQASLREVFQWMNQNYAKKGRFFADSDGVHEAAEAVSHADMGWFFAKYVAGLEEIPWNEFLRSVGLRVVEGTNSVADPTFVASRNFDGPMQVVSLTAGGEAEKAGLRAGDTVLEINGAAVGEESYEQMRGLASGDAITVKVERRHGDQRELKWKVGAREEVTYEVKDVEHLDASERDRRAAWLKGEARTFRSPDSR
jgi:predicted metalloprotease with PDZ domain